MMSKRLFLLRTFCAVLGCIFLEESHGAERTFYFSLPIHGYEAGDLGEVGRIYSSEPVSSNLTVRLESDAILQVPASVTIPAGRSSAPFTISILDDDLYDMDYASAIRAKAEGWADGEGRIPIIDNDHPGLTISAPQFIYGNQSAEGEIQLNTARRGPAVVTLQVEDGIGVTVPATVTVPAGETVARFPITFLSPIYVAKSLIASIPYVGNVFWNTCKIVTLADDPVPRNLFGRDLPSGVRSGSVLRLSAILGYSFDRPQNTNAIGELRLIDPAGQVNFPTQIIQFTNGVWSGEIAFEGSGSSLMLEYSAAGLTSLTGPFDLIGGGDLRALVLETQWNRQSQMFYISTASTTNAPPRLIAVTPTNPSVILKSIDLPAEASAISVSDNATAAWLVLTNRKFLRIDLITWTLGPQFDGPGRVRDILLLPGETDKFVAVISGEDGALAGWQVKLFVAGAQNGASAALVFPPDTSNPVAELVRGRDSSEVFCSTLTDLFRLEVSDGLQPAGQIQLGGAPGTLRYAGGKLYHALGGVIDPETLDVTQRYEVPNSTLAIVPVPELNRVFQFVRELGETRVCSFELTSGKLLTCWVDAMVLHLSDPATVVAWDRGFALKTDFGLTVIEPPLIRIGIADLAVRFLGPTNQVYMGPSFAWEFEVENCGPDIAFHTELVVDNFGWSLAIGTLLPGEKRRITPGVTGTDAFVQGEIRVTSPLHEPNPTNNVVRVLTLVDLRPPGADWRSIPMVVSALAASANRERVYAAYSSRPEMEGPGIVVVEGATAAINKTMPATATLLKIEVTPDETFVFGLAESNVVRRWNLELESVDQTWTVENGPVLDFTVAANDAVVIATVGRCSLYKAGMELPSIIESTASRKAVKIVAGSLWLVEDNQLRRIEITETGLTVVEGPFELQNFEPQFVVDGDRFYFDVSTFNTNTRTAAPDGRDGNPSPIPVAFSELEALVTQNWQQLKVLTRDGLKLLGEETLPAGAFLKSAVRFGDRGIAFAGDRKELLLYHVGGVPLPVAPADLSVSITPPLLYSRQPVTWELTVTNHSDVVALNAKVVFYGLNIYQWNVETNSDPQNYNVIPLGNLGAHQAKTVSLTTWIHDATQQGAFSLRVRTSSSSPDPSYANNEAIFSGAALPEPSYLRVTVAATNRATLGETITINYTVENAGPNDLELVQFTATRYERVYGELLSSPPAFALSAGETKTFQVPTTITHAGLLSVTGSALADNHRNVDASNFAAELIFVPDAATPFETLALPGEVRTGNAPRGEMIVALTTPSGLAGVDPRTFEPNWFVPVEGYVGQIITTVDGRYVWFLSGSEAMRIDLETEQIDLRFGATNLEAYEAFPVSIATLPGQPDVLLVSYSDHQNFQRKTVAFRNGVALPNKLVALGRFGISAEGRIFFSAWGEAGLQELALNETGLSVITTFPTGESIAPIAVIGTKVFFSFGRIFDVATGAIDDSLREGRVLVADANAVRVWRTYERGGRFYLENYHVASGAADWRVPISGELWNVAAVGNWVIVPSLGGFQAGYELIFPKMSDLAIRGEVPDTVAGPGVDFAATISVTNRAGWLAGEVKLALDLPEGTLLLDNARGWIKTNRYEKFVSNPVTHQLETFDPPWTVWLKLPTPGLHEIVARVSGVTVESNLLDNEARFQINVDPLPVFLIDEITMLEGTDTINGFAGITAGLDAPAPRDMEINYTVTPINGDENDILYPPQSRFVFYKGRTDAFSRVFYGDSIPELTEQFRIDFSADQITLVRTQTIVTLLNDDFPVISAPPTNQVAEGNSGLKPLLLTVSRTPAPFESEVEFETVSGTAVANRDFVPTSGRFVFAPGELSKTVEIGIIGNTEFETNKQFTFRLKNPLAAAVSPAATVIIIRPDDPPPAFETRIVRNAGTFVEFPILPGVRYQLEYKTRMTDVAWQTTTGILTIIGSTGRFALPPNAATTRFVRVKATVQ